MSEIWEAIQTNFVIILMVTARVSGIFTFNPIFSRNGVPNMVKAGASLMLALVMAAAGDFSYTIPQGVLPFALDIGKELLVGFTLGFFVNLMLQLFSLAGELSDYQIGLSMARSYDPTFGTTSLVTQYYSWWFMIYFFMVGGHLSYIKLFFISYESIPMGFSSFNFNVGLLIVKYFETVLTLGLKLAVIIRMSPLADKATHNDVCRMYDCAKTRLLTLVGCCTLILLYICIAVMHIPSITVYGDDCRTCPDTS